MCMTEKNVPVWKINGLSLPFNFDFNDLESMRKYEDIFTTMQARAERMKSCKLRTDVIKIQCEAVFEAFDSLFGEGTADKLFHGKYNIDTCDAMMDQFSKFVNESVLKSDQNRVQRIQRYQGKKPADHKRKKKPYHA